MKATADNYLEVTKARYVSGYKIHVSFNDGMERIVDFAPFLAKARNPDTTDYRDLRKFKRFRIHSGDLVWGDYQMIFPIMDLYNDTILPANHETRVYEKRSPKTVVSFSKRLPLKGHYNFEMSNPLKNVVSGKTISIKRKKRLQHA